jgi:hypothetical protein
MAIPSSDVVCLGQFTADVIVTHVKSLPEKGKAISGVTDNLRCFKLKAEEGLWNSKFIYMALSMIAYYSATCTMVSKQSIVGA